MVMAEVLRIRDAAERRKTCATIAMQNALVFSDRKAVGQVSSKYVLVARGHENPACMPKLDDWVRSWIPYVLTH
jgi:hypothetical protein